MYEPCSTTSGTRLPGNTSCDLNTTLPYRMTAKMRLSDQLQRSESLSSAPVKRAGAPSPGADRKGSPTLFFRLRPRTHAGQMPCAGKEVGAPRLKGSPTMFFRLRRQC